MDNNPVSFNKDCYFAAWHQELHEFLMKSLPNLIFINENPGSGCPKGYITVLSGGLFKHEIAYIIMRPSEEYVSPNLVFRWFTSNKNKSLISKAVFSHSQTTRY